MAAKTNRLNIDGIANWLKYTALATILPSGVLIIAQEFRDNPAAPDPDLINDEVQTMIRAIGTAFGFKISAATVRKCIDAVLAVLRDRRAPAPPVPMPAGRRRKAA